MATHTHKCTKTPEGTLLSFLVSFCLCFSVCVLSLLQCCAVYSALFGWVELHACQSSPSCPVSWSHSAQYRQELQFTRVFHSTISQWQAGSLPPRHSPPLIALSLFLSLTLSPQCTHRFTPLYLHLSLLDMPHIHYELQVIYGSKTWDVACLWTWLTCLDACRFY